MIQELFGGGSASASPILLGERKISIPFSSPSSTCPPTPILTTTPISTTTSSTTVANSSNSSNGGNSSSSNHNSSEPNSTQNLRCPRCDSTNTKFCYYNNYNLTQPRHFCKTCRRYWTKGGTLRNVPIGGGCRKNKSITANGSSTTLGISKSSSNAMAKAKATLSTEMLVNGNPGFLGNGLLDHLHPELQSAGPSSILWPSLPQTQNSHILALLRGATEFPNPNPSPTTNSSVFTTALGLDSYGNGAPSAHGSFSRNNQHQLSGFGSGVPNFVQDNGSCTSNILELYQRLKSSSGYSYCGTENPGEVTLGSMVGPTSSSATNSIILDSAPVGRGGDHLGGYSFSNSPAISSWSDFPTVPINGAFP